MTKPFSLARAFIEACLGKAPATVALSEGSSLISAGHHRFADPADRAERIPDNFYAWLDLVPAWPSDEAEVIGPRRPKPHIRLKRLSR